MLLAGISLGDEAAPREPHIQRAREDEDGTSSVVFPRSAHGQALKSPTASAVPNRSFFSLTPRACFWVMAEGDTATAGNT